MSLPFSSRSRSWPRSSVLVPEALVPEALVLGPSAHAWARPWFPLSSCPRPVPSALVHVRRVCRLGLGPLTLRRAEGSALSPLSPALTRAGRPFSIPLRPSISRCPLLPPAVDSRLHPRLSPSFPLLSLHYPSVPALLPSAPTTRAVSPSLPCSIPLCPQVAPDLKGVGADQPCRCAEGQEGPSRRLCCMII